MEKYNIYKYFKGEKTDPFDIENQNIQHRFWDYEFMFEEKFNKGNFSHEVWITSNYFDKTEWIEVLNHNPVNKEELFKLWLFHILNVHLPDKAESESDSVLNRLYWDCSSVAQ
jgi:hypothetical protein